MKISLNNRNVTLRQCNTGIANCYECCFIYNLDLCDMLELRDNSICRTIKTLDNHKLNDIFIL